MTKNVYTPDSWEMHATQITLFSLSITLPSEALSYGLLTQLDYTSNSENVQFNLLLLGGQTWFSVLGLMPILPLKILFDINIPVFLNGARNHQGEQTT
jgi:hypothetical protein